MTRSLESTAGARLAVPARRRRVERRMPTLFPPAPRPCVLYRLIRVPQLPTRALVAGAPGRGCSAAVRPLFGWDRRRPQRRGPILTEFRRASGGEESVGRVAVKGVTKRFADVTAVDDFTLEVADEEFLVLLGPSGCGKSTA